MKSTETNRAGNSKNQINLISFATELSAPHGSYVNDIIIHNNNSEFFLKIVSWDLLV
jgi:hypothetical protein